MSLENAQQNFAQSYKDYQEYKTNEQTARNQTLVEIQRIQNLARQQAIDQRNQEHREWQENRGDRRDYIREALDAFKAQASLNEGYDQTINNAMKRLEMASDDETRILEDLTKSNKANRMAENDRAFYTHLTKELSTRYSRISDINAAIQQVVGGSNQYSYIDRNVLKGIFGPVWLQIQTQHIQDPATIEKMLTATWQNHLTNSYEGLRSSEEVEQMKAKLAEVRQVKEEIARALSRSGGNRIPTREEYYKMHYGPFLAILNGMDGGPVIQGRNNHFATGLAVIGYMGNGSPVKIRPEAWGGIVNGNQVVPSKVATLAEISEIERLNKGGKKFLDKPTIEDVTDKPLEKPKEEPLEEYVPLQEQVKASTPARYQEGIQKISEGIVPLVTSFRANPAGGMGYGVLLRAIGEQVYTISQKTGLPPDQVYKDLVTAIINNDPKNYSILRDPKQVMRLAESFTDLMEIEIIPNRNDPDKVRHGVASSPWMRGKWPLPASYQDLGYFVNEMSKRIQKAQQEEK